MKNFMIKFMINWLAKRGHIIHPEVQSNISDAFQEMILGRGEKFAYCVVYNGKLCTAGKRNRYLIFETLEEAKQYAFNNLEDFVEMRYEKIKIKRI